MTKQTMHFRTRKERLDYLKGGYEEIVPVIAKPEGRGEAGAPKKGERKRKVAAK